MHILGQRKLILLSLHHIVLRVCMFIHFIMSYLHFISCAFLLLIICMYMHIRSPEGVTLLEFEAEEQEDRQETQQQDTPEGGDQDQKELPECPNHRHASFLKGKPRSILSLLCFTKYHLSPLCLMH